MSKKKKMKISEIGITFLYSETYNYQNLLLLKRCLVSTI